MNKWLRYTLIALLVMSLVLVRKFESVLFYDPFLRYFHGKIGRAYYPDYDLPKVIWNVAFRFLLNAFLSLMIIWLIFLNKRYVTFSACIYFIFLLLLLPLYIYLVTHYFDMGNNLGFYIRRFLIQPLLLLLLIPAFVAYKPQK